jgi:hypothetical protein
VRGEKISRHFSIYFVLNFENDFNQGLEGMSILAEKCMHLKPSATNGLTSLLVGILSENPEVNFKNKILIFL